MHTHTAVPTPLTIPEIAGRKASAGIGIPLAMITAYDVVSARLADRAGADLLLVGDSLGMVLLGRAHTLSVTMDEMVHHARAVAAAAPRALIVGDLPFICFEVL
jgi:3-methyl-2-oxobutanoate hydroxymethyltransferase